MAKRNRKLTEEVVAEKTTIGPDENGRYYYKAKSGSGLMNLKSPLEDERYEEITAKEFHTLEPKPHEPTAEELARREKLSRIAALKSQLAATDYQAIKHSEGWISEEDYAEIKAARQALRDEINELEAQL